MASTDDTVAVSELDSVTLVARDPSADRELQTKNFLIRCPPDVPPRSRIVAVCGTPSIEDANPTLDGWFLSDFYLFHHLFSPLYEPTTAQVWLTCLDPEELVATYKEFAHGDPSRDNRRIVLDSSRLERVHAAGNLRVVSRKDLADTFLSTVREHSRLAATHAEHLIVMIFGHRDILNSDVSIGNGKVSCTQLGIMLRGNNSDVTLVNTAYYSGGWLVKQAPKKRLNVTGLAAANTKQESLSWPKSRSLGRASGGLFASALLYSLTQVEDDAAKQKEDDDDLRADSQVTYAGLCAAIHNATEQLTSHFKLGQSISFSAQNDEWEVNYQTRVGTSLLGFQRRWEELQPIQASGDGEGHMAGSAPLGPDIPPPPPHLPLNSITRHTELGIQSLAQLYSKYDMGPDNTASNNLFHSTVHKLARGEGVHVKDTDIAFARDHMLHRLVCQDLADMYVAEMGLTSLNTCGEMKYEDYYRAERQNRTVYDMVYTKLGYLFPRAPDYRISFIKPYLFLTWTLVHNGIAVEEHVDAAAKRLQKISRRLIRDMIEYWDAKEVLEDPTVNKQLNEFRRFFRDRGRSIVKLWS